MKKILMAMASIVITITPTSLLISCFPGDITFKSKLSERVSIMNTELGFEDLNEEIILTYIYEHVSLNTEETKKGISVTEIKKSDNPDEAFATIFVSEDNQKFESETFIMTIILNL